MGENGAIGSAMSDPHSGRRRRGYDAAASDREAKIEERARRDWDAGHVEGHKTFEGYLRSLTYKFTG